MFAKESTPTTPAVWATPVSVCMGNRIKKYATSEGAIILEAIIGLALVRWLFGFEAMVMAALAVIIGYVCKPK